jgi:hypothetical protein
VEAVREAVAEAIDGSPSDVSRREAKREGM